MRKQTDSSGLQQRVRKARAAALSHQAASDSSGPPPDCLRLLVNQPGRFAALVKHWRLSPGQRSVLLGLLKRTAEQLILDLRANWSIKHLGHNSEPEHDYWPIPDQLLYAAQNQADLDTYIQEFRYELAGLTPRVTMQVAAADVVSVTHPAITTDSNVTVEVLPEFLELQDCRLEIKLAQVKRFQVVITNQWATGDPGPRPGRLAE